MNILFVCLANLQRSPTAEEMVRERTEGEVEAKSGGISPNASTRVSRDLLEWADRIYAMMGGIKKRIQAEFPDILKQKEVRVLGIRDRYRKGEPRLKRRLLEEFSKDDFLSGVVDEGEIEGLPERETEFSQP